MVFVIINIFYNDKNIAIIELQLFELAKLLWNENHLSL